MFILSRFKLIRTIFSILYLIEINNFKIINAQEIPFNSGTCINNPGLVHDLIRVGETLGVSITKGVPRLPNKDATYEAYPGEIGDIIITKRPLKSIFYCMLVTHEFIHVLQHLNGNLTAVTPLGWKLTYQQIYSYQNLLEAEAYAYQNYPKKVILNLNRYVNNK